MAEHYRQRYNTAPTQPSWIVRADRESRVLDYARWGLVNSWAKDNKRAARQINARAETVHERPFTIITTDANEVIAPIHDRMPVILDSNVVDDWLFAPPEEADRLRQLLVPAPATAVAVQDAHPDAGNVRNDRPELLSA